MFRKKEEPKITEKDKAETLNFVYSKLIEALRNGKSAPFYMNFTLLCACLKVLANKEDLCIKKSPLDPPYLRKESYFNSEDFIAICPAGDCNRYIIRSYYKSLVQDLKHALDNKLQFIDQEYDKLFPIEGWNSEYDEFMD